MHRALGILVAVLATVLAARLELNLPGTPVPQSLQTLAVVLTGAWLGARDGGAAMLSYVGLGLLGVPLFAGGAAGVATLTGPTGGYLLGFVLGASTCGAVVERASAAAPRVGATLLGALLAHAIILGGGWIGLGGGMAAWQQGVAPFLWGGVFKSVAAAALVALVSRVRRPLG